MYREIEEVAGGTFVEAWAGELVAVRSRKNEIDLRIEQSFDHRPPPPPEGRLARLWRRLRRPPTAVPPPPEVRTFSITRPPMATDAHRHPVFLQLAGALAIDAVAPGDRVFVIREVFTALLPDDPSMRARVVAAFDRTDSRTGSRTGP